MNAEVAHAFSINAPNDPTVYRFGDQLVALSASSPGVLAALQQILVPSRQDAALSPDSMTSGAALSTQDGWHLEVDGKRARGLALSTPLPKVADELIASVGSAIAKKQSSIWVNGAVLTKDAATIALIGDDNDSVKVLAFHLLARGWSVITFAHAFLSGSTLEIVGLRALASVSSSSIDQIPPRYRAAVETSRWYDAGYDLIFYTVDPIDVHRQGRQAAALTHTVLVDGELEDVPALSNNIDALETGPIGKHPLINSICRARLTLGPPIPSCDVIEQWLSTTSYV